jgi:hypothetical protein
MNILHSRVETICRNVEIDSFTSHVFRNVFRFSVFVDDVFWLTVFTNKITKK